VNVNGAEGKALVGKRIGGRVIDYIVVAFASWILSTPFRAATAQLGESFAQVSWQDQLMGRSSDVLLQRFLVMAPLLFVIGVVTSVIWNGLYFGLMESVFGYTVGKRVLGLQVVAEDGGKLTFAAAFVRNLLYALSPLIGGLIELVTLISAEDGRRLGDKWARAHVVTADAAGATVVPSAGVRLPGPPTPVTDDYRPCPICAEPVRSAAVKCRHCGADLVDRAAGQ